MPNGQGFDYSFGHMGGCIDNYSHFFTGLVRIAMTFGGKVRKFGEMGNILET